MGDPAAGHVLYAWNLSSVTGNSFYNAAVYSGTMSWKAFTVISMGGWSGTDEAMTLAKLKRLVRLHASDVG
ncbi:hypothetical protein ABT063_32850 [Streptomyces sp. NPDC002838]|uniref:hypothetical protein n=1 Tax=Streptomyces sp. NPDC002838 TaxID=3154436 RepID=UPI003329C1FB